MENIELILISDFCRHYEVPDTFISELQQSGLVEVVSEEQQDFLRAEQLGELERLVRLHKEMDINLEGIEAIAHLLQRVSDLQRQMRLMRQRLYIYEGDSIVISEE